MGNCNSDSSAKQKCTGCGFKKCDCTAGLDSVCGRCDPSWKRQIPGTYDAQYNAWVRANPRPIKPVFDPQPPLNSMDFVCTQCVQCQDFSGITAGGSLDIKDPSQVMQCIGKMKDKQESDVKAAEASAAKAAADAKIAADAAAAKAAADAAAAGAGSGAGSGAGAGSGSGDSSQLLILLAVIFVIFMIIMGVVMAFAFRGGADSELLATVGAESINR
jgi:hypothetical protein